MITVKVADLMSVYHRTSCITIKYLNYCIFVQEIVNRNILIVASRKTISVKPKREQSFEFAEVHDRLYITKTITYKTCTPMSNII